MSRVLGRGSSLWFWLALPVVQFLPYKPEQQQQKTLYSQPTMPMVEYAPCEQGLDGGREASPCLWATVAWMLVSNTQILGGE